MPFTKEEIEERLTKANNLVGTEWYVGDPERDALLEALGSLPETARTLYEVQAVSVLNHDVRIRMATAETVGLAIVLGLEEFEEKVQLEAFVRKIDFEEKHWTIHD